VKDLISYIPSVLSGFVWIGILVICIIAQSKTQQKGWGMMIGFAASRVVLLVVQPFIFNYLYSVMDRSDNFGLIINLIGFLIGLIPLTFLFIGLFQFYNGHMRAKHGEF